jgi:hypothetical protein
MQRMSGRLWGRKRDEQNREREGNLHLRPIIIAADAEWKFVPLPYCVQHCAFLWLLIGSIQFGTKLKQRKVLAWMSFLCLSFVNWYNLDTIIHEY